MRSARSAVMATCNPATCRLNDGEGTGRSCVRKEADKATFRVGTFCASEKYPGRQWTKDQIRIHIDNVISPQIVGAPDQSDRPRCSQMTTGGPGENPKRERHREEDQRRQVGHISSWQHMVSYRHTLPTPLYLDMECRDGNGDVKPDHPSGPGTYGHVM